MPRPAATALLMGLIAASLAMGAEMATPAIAVIVGKESFVNRVTTDDLREIYLRRQRVWSNGMRAIPINLPADNPIREQFSRLVLGRSTQELVPYWNKEYFEGITPPTVLPSAAAIRAYLSVEPAAIAYLPVPEVDDTCRTLIVLER